MLRRPFLRFGGLATLGLGAAAGALLSACGTRQAGGMPDAAVFEAASGRRIRPGDLVARMAATPIVLLGERHDNPVHHRFRADLIGAWTDAARGRPTAVVFEHFDREHDAALRVAQHTGPSVAARATTAPEALDRLLEAARFDRTVWGWPLHRPLFEAAAAGGALWIAANFSRASARRPAADAEPVLTAIVQSARWTDAAQRSLEQSLREGHCNLLPERAIVVDEAISSGLGYALAAVGAPIHDVLALTGGAIGQGLPVAVGAAVACPDRRVIALQADGSGMYTLQALWTMARESLDVTVVLLSNRSYRILQVELMRAGVGEPGPGAVGLTDLSRPELDWVALATGMGVEARRAATADQLVDALRISFATSGPTLVEVVL